MDLRVKFRDSLNHCSTRAISFLVNQNIRFLDRQNTFGLCFCKGEREKLRVALKALLLFPIPYRNSPVKDRDE